MLIPSTRHTSADIALWAELEDADRLHGASLTRKIEQAAAAVREFISAGSSYASTSWGKDSVVMLHLLWIVAPHVPVVNLRIDPTRNEYCDTVRDAFLSRFPMDYHEENVSYHGCGEWFSQQWDDASYKRWDAAWRNVEKQFGARHLSGVRAQESGVRKIRMRSHGHSTSRTCAPIGWMTTADVFAYLAINDLPTHPNYAMLGGGRYDREKLRVSEFGDQGGVCRGRREWEQEYYGDVLRRIKAK